MIRNPIHMCVSALVRMCATRTNYWAEFGVDMTLVVVLIFEGWRRHTGGPLAVLLAVAIGLLAFSFVEYFFHRWLFHTRISLLAEGHRMHYHHRDSNFGVTTPLWDILLHTRYVCHSGKA